MQWQAKIALIGCACLVIFLAFAVYAQQMATSYKASCLDQEHILVELIEDHDDADAVAACEQIRHGGVKKFFGQFPWGPFKGKIFSKTIMLYIS